MKSQNLSIKSQHIKACPPFPCWPSALITLLGLGRNIRWPGGIIHIHMRPKLTKVLAGALYRQMRHYIFINSSNGSKHCSKQAGRLVCTAELRGKSEKLGADATVCDAERLCGAAATSLSHLPLAAKRGARGAVQFAALTDRRLRLRQHRQRLDWMRSSINWRGRASSAARRQYHAVMRTFQ